MKRRVRVRVELDFLVREDLILPVLNLEKWRREGTEVRREEMKWGREMK